jgi:hypothetical protein
LSKSADPSLAVEFGSGVSVRDGVGSEVIVGIIFPDGGDGVGADFDLWDFLG